MKSLDIAAVGSAVYVPDLILDEEDDFVVDYDDFNTFLSQQSDTAAYNQEVLVAIQESNEHLELQMECLISCFALFLVGCVMVFAYKFIRIFV